MFRIQPCTVAPGAVTIEDDGDRDDLTPLHRAALRIVKLVVESDEMFPAGSLLHPKARNPMSSLGVKVIERAKLLLDY